MALNLTPHKLIASQPIGTTAGGVQYYIVVNNNAVVKKCVITNITAGALNFTIWVVPAAGSTANGNLICAAVTVSGNTTYIVNELNGQVLSVGDSIWALASAATSLNIAASGYTF